MNEYKSCPFCDDLPAVLMTKIGYEISHKCQHEGTWRAVAVIADTEAELAAAWNTRTKETPNETD